VVGVFSPVAFFFLKTRPPEPAVRQPAPRLTPDRSAPAVITSELAGSVAPVSTELAAPEPAVPQPTTPQSLAKPVGSAPENRARQQSVPAPIVFTRADFSFNRRFFETKMANFLKLVPSSADKDMVLWIKSARGEFSGRRITQITPAELRLQIFKGEATADETIPFVEIFEVQIRHKDFVA